MSSKSSHNELLDALRGSVAEQLGYVAPKQENSLLVEIGQLLSDEEFNQTKEDLAKKMEEQEEAEDSARLARYFARQAEIRLEEIQHAKEAFTNMVTALQASEVEVQLAHKYYDIYSLKESDIRQATYLYYALVVGRDARGLPLPPELKIEDLGLPALTYVTVLTDLGAQQEQIDEVNEKINAQLEDPKTKQVRLKKSIVEVCGPGMSVSLDNVLSLHDAMSQLNKVIFNNTYPVEDELVELEKEAAKIITRVKEAEQESLGKSLYYALCPAQDISDIFKHHMIKLDAAGLVFVFRQVDLVLEDKFLSKLTSDAVATLYSNNGRSTKYDLFRVRGLPSCFYWMDPFTEEDVIGILTDAGIPVNPLNLTALELMGSNLHRAFKKCATLDREKEGK